MTPSVKATGDFDDNVYISLSISYCGGSCEGVMVRAGVIKLLEEGVSLVSPKIVYRKMRTFINLHVTYCGGSCEGVMVRAGVIKLLEEGV